LSERFVVAAKYLVRGYVANSDEARTKLAKFGIDTTVKWAERDLTWVADYVTERKAPNRMDEFERWLDVRLAVNNGLALFYARDFGPNAVIEIRTAD
jgi:hypothetical protein